MSNKVARGEHFIKFSGDFASDRKSKIFFFSSPPAFTSVNCSCLCLDWVVQASCISPSGQDTWEATRLEGACGHRAAARCGCLCSASPSVAEAVSSEDVVALTQPYTKQLPSDTTIQDRRLHSEGISKTSCGSDWGNSI